MRNKFSKLALVATFGLALAFTFSCSSDKDDDKTPSGSPSGGGQGGSFNENSQIYNKDGTRYTGSGIIDAGFIPNLIRVGNVASGIVNLELNEVPDNEYLSEYLDDFLDDGELARCISYPENIKFFGSGSRRFVLTNSNGEDLGMLGASYEGEQMLEQIIYYYFSEAGKITCNFDVEDVWEGGVDRYNKILNLDVIEGWNKIYFRGYLKNGIETWEFSTSDILTKEVKWIFSPFW
jgi:hypothetical protein